MPASNVETMTNPRDSLPNVYTNVHAREVDFVTRFGDNWEALRNILGIMRPIRKAAGTQLISFSASVALESGAVDAGEVIPYSKATIVQSAKGDLTIEKYAKAVPIEDVNQYGAEIAVEKSDDAFLNQLQGVVLTRFYTFLNTGILTDVESTYQMALAMAKGMVLDKFQKMRKSVTDVIGFCNILDVYEYIGAASITVQTQFGLNYVEDFMGYSTLFLLSDPDIQRGRVIAVPVENIDLYYIDPSDSEFAKLGLEYTTQGETNLIGFHAQGNYSTAVGESYALMGMSLWAEYLDGIAVVTYGGSMGSITFTSGAATNTTGATKLTVTAPESIPADWTFYAKAASGTAPSAPSYGTVLPDGWTKVTLVNGVADNVTGFTSGHKMTMVAVNASDKVVSASSSVDVVVKA